MQPRLDRAKRHAQPIRYLIQSQVLPETQNDHDPVLRDEPRDRARNLVINQHLAEGVIRFDFAGGIQLHHPQSAVAAHPITADVDHDPLEPLPEAVRLAQARPALPGFDQRVLDGVLRLGCVAEEVSGQAIRIVRLGSGGAAAVDFFPDTGYTSMTALLPAPW